MLAQHQMKRSIGIDGTRDTAGPRNRQLRHGADLDFVAASVEHQVNTGGSLGVIDWNGSIVFDKSSPTDDQDRVIEQQAHESDLHSTAPYVNLARPRIASTEKSANRSVVSYS
ncbi:hypothetical protein ACIOC1_04250 [Streptomyces sp. NPDC088197]|uniref:hypothetical protein n=1 Tax=Streptomyces sp. NPDC088197 TaxID=3365840 RepID=UPI00380AF9B0